MSIKAGDRIPNGTLKHKTSDGVTDISTEQLFSGKKVVVFAVPGAFTPTYPGLSQKQLKSEQKA